MTRVLPASLRHLLLVLGLSGLSVVAACSAEEVSPGAEPTSISIAPSTVTPQDAPSSAMSSGSGSAGASVTPSSAGVDALVAVAAAEAAVADSAAVELSREDDDGGGSWAVTLRAGQNGRGLQIGANGQVVDNTSEQLDQDQLGDPPTVSIQRAIETAQQRVSGGRVTDAELTTEDGRRVWDVSVGAAGGDRELWIDAASGEVVREERD
jgi:uncharacterized membrane protein YkoI